jgi:hypothetical protein
MEPIETLKAFLDGFKTNTEIFSSEDLQALEQIIVKLENESIKDVVEGIKNWNRERSQEVRKIVISWINPNSRSNLQPIPSEPSEKEIMNRFRELRPAVKKRLEEIKLEQKRNQGSQNER